MSSYNPYRKVLLNNKVLVLGLLGLFIFLVALWIVYLQGFESTDNAYVKGNVTVIKPKVGGYVKAVYVSENQYVKKGQRIAEINALEYSNLLKQADAHLALLETTSESLKYELEVQRSKINEARAALSAYKAGANRARKRFERIKELTADGTASNQEYDDAFAASQEANAQALRGEATVETALKALTLCKLKAKENEERIKEAKAALEIAKFNYHNTIITAPVSGRIGKNSIRVGQLLNVGEAIAYLIPDEPVWVEANFKEVQVEDMRPGQDVILKVDAFSNIEFKGIVDSISPASGAEYSILPPENSTGNFTKVVQRFPVKITFSNGQNISMIKPGMSVFVKVKIN